MKCFEVTPSPDTNYDTLTVPAGEDGWEEAKRLVEESLDMQFAEIEDGGPTWEHLSVTIKCVEISEDDFAALCER